MKFEEKLAKLDEIVSKLENPELPLEDSMELFQAGVTLAKECYETVRDTKGKLEILSEDLRKTEWNIDED